MHVPPPLAVYSVDGFLSMSYECVVLLSVHSEMQLPSVLAGYIAKFTTMSFQILPTKLVLLNTHMFQSHITVILPRTFNAHSNLTSLFTDDQGAREGTPFLEAHNMCNPGMD